MNYVQAIEAYFSEKIRDLYLKKDKSSSLRLRSQKRQNEQMDKIDLMAQRHELLQVFTVSVEEVKK